jgi:hypothetical protein
MKKKSIDIEHSCLDPGVKHRDDGGERGVKHRDDGGERGVKRPDDE